MGRPPGARFGARSSAITSTSVPPPVDPAASAAERPRAHRSLLPLWISLTVHALGLGAGVWLYVAAPPAPAHVPLNIDVAQVVEPPQTEIDIQPVDPVERFDQPEEIELPEDPILPPDAAPDDSTLPDELPPLPRPPLQLLPEIPIRAVKVRVKVAPPTPPPAPSAPDAPKVAKPKRPGRPLRVTYRPDLRLYYPREMQLRGIEGTTVVGIDVNPAGRVTNAWIVESSGWPLLDRQALRVMYDHRFAVGDGGRAQVPVDFRLQ